MSWIRISFIADPDPCPGQIFTSQKSTIGQKTHLNTCSWIRIRIRIHNTDPVWIQDHQMNTDRAGPDRQHCFYIPCSTPFTFALPHPTTPPRASIMYCRIGKRLPVTQREETLRERHERLFFQSFFVKSYFQLFDEKLLSAICALPCSFYGFFSAGADEDGLVERGAAALEVSEQVRTINFLGLTKVCRDTFVVEPVVGMHISVTSNKG